MKNIFRTYLVLALIGLVIYSCTESDNTIDGLFDDITNGAVLRGDNDTLINEIILDVEPALFYLDIEEQDNQDGGLLESVDVYVTYNDNSDIAGDSSGAAADEVFAFNIPASEFSPDEFGLPATSINMPLTQLLSLVGLTSDQQIYVNDTFLIRLELNLTDGRVFSDYNAGGIITGGFFNSPFLYVCTIESGVDLAFTNEGANNVNLGAGAVNEGYSADVAVTEAVEDLWTEVSVYASYVDNNDEDATDFSTDEVLVGTFPRALFADNPETEDNEDDLITSLSFTLAEIDGGVSIDDMTVGDQINLRYEVLNNAGRALTADTPPFLQVVPVISCPVPPLADDSLFIGDYQLEHISQGIFGYNTFGEGEVVELFSGATDDGQNSPGVPLAATQRSFDASYLFDLGSGLYHTYIIEFNCTSVTIVPDAGPIGGFTGWTCTQANSLIIGEQIGGGDFDVTDDAEFTMGFRDDVFDDCGFDPPVFGSIKFVKQD